MADEIIDNFLSHFGVKGMKWGVRKGGVSTGRRAASEDHQKLVATKAKRGKHLSDAEIKAAIGRMNLERQYNSLNPTTVGKGYKFAVAALAVGGTLNAAYTFAKSPAGQIVADTVKKILTKA